MPLKMPQTGPLWQGFFVSESEKFNGDCRMLKKGQHLSAIINGYSIKRLFY